MQGQHNTLLLPPTPPLRKKSTAFSALSTKVSLRLNGNLGFLLLAVVVLIVVALEEVKGGGGGGGGDADKDVEEEVEE